MKSVDFLKAIGGAAAVVFALNVYAQASDAAPAASAQGARSCQGPRADPHLHEGSGWCRHADGFGAGTRPDRYRYASRSRRARRDVGSEQADGSLEQLNMPVRFAVRAWT